MKAKHTYLLVTVLCAVTGIAAYGRGDYGWACINAFFVGANFVGIFIAD